MVVKRFVTLAQTQEKGEWQEGTQTSETYHDKLAHSCQKDTFPQVVSETSFALTVMPLLPLGMSSFAR